MMEALRSYLASIVVVTLLLALVQNLVPEGSLRQTASFLGGLVLLAALLGPAAELDLSGLEADLGVWQAAVEDRQAELLEAQQKELSAVIAEETSTYISDKAEELGLSVAVRVETRPGADGVPVPWAAELTGQRSAALAACMAEDLGIPAERQVWHERETES